MAVHARSPCTPTGRKIINEFRHGKKQRTARLQLIVVRLSAFQRRRGASSFHVFDFAGELPYAVGVFFIAVVLLHVDVVITSAKEDIMFSSVFVCLLSHHTVVWSRYIVYFCTCVWDELLPF